jgi:putative ABC transport system permease protein
MTGPTPRLALWIVSRCLPPTIAEDAAGDLEERWRADRSASRWRAWCRVTVLAIAVGWQGMLARWRRADAISSRGAMTRTLSIRQDIAFAFRVIRRAPVAAVAVIVTLALGIGATVTLFAVAHAWLIRPLPFADPDRLVAVWETIPSADIFQNTPAPAVLREWQARATSFERLAPATSGTMNLTGEGAPARLQALEVSTDLLNLLGRSPALGRGFVASDAERPAPDVALLSHRAWQSRFGGADDVVGRVLRLDGRAVQIVGVLPADLRLLTFDVDLWVPLILTPQEAASENRFLWVLGRLKPGVTVERASAEVDRIALERSGGGMGGRVVGLHAQTVGTVADDVVLLFGASALVLLIACANVASLTLAQVMARRRELVTRAALGASRWRIARQVLVECVAISIAGGLGGLLLAGWASRSLAALVPGSAQYGGIDVFDPVVAGFALGASLLTAVLFGLVPAWQATGGDVAAAMRDGVRGATPGRQRTMRVLVVSEVALALVLLVATGLILRSFQHLSAMDLGFRADGLVMMDLPRPAGSTDSTFFADLEAALSAQPAVRGVALSQGLPLVAIGSMGSRFVIEGQPVENGILSYWRIVNGDYFRTLEIPLRAGRAFDATDVSGAADVAIVTESFARRAWPDGPAVGRRIGWGSLDSPLTVVGVAGDVRQSPTIPAGPHVYMPYRQVEGRLADQLAVRADLPPDAVPDLVRSVVRQLDEAQPVARVRTSDDLLGRALGLPRFHLVLFGAFAAVAVTLAVIGLYGVLSFLVAQRRREVGIRMALGATPGSIRGLWLRQSLVMTGIGLVVGLGVSFSAGRVLEGMLSGVTPADAATHVVAAVVVAVTAGLASLGPAHRAATVDPIEPLRE